MQTKITVYSTPTCPWCRKVKSYLKSLGVSFTDVDVSKNPQKAQEMYRKSGQMGVPVVIIGNQVIVGFDKNKIDKILDVS